MKRLIAVPAVAGLMLVGCGGDDDSSEPATTASAATGTATAPPPAATGTTIKVDGSDYGQILFDGSDQAIYLFEKETGPTSECYGDCAEAWPPVVTKGSPQAGRKIDAALLGTAERKDGTTQVTYAGHPLYYYEGDLAGRGLLPERRGVRRALAGGDRRAASRFEAASRRPAGS